MKTLIVFINLVLVTRCLAQDTAKEDGKLGLGALSVGRFATSMLAEMGKELGNDNIVINPVTIWTILAMVYPSATGTTKTELATLMNIDTANSDQVDQAYSAISNTINGNSSQVESRLLNVVVKAMDLKLHEDFVNRVTNVFSARQFSVDLAKQDEAARRINEWAADVTKKRITDVIPPADFQGLSVLLGSAAYFKGKWKVPFEANATSNDKFKNDDDAIISPEVPMMRNRGMFNYTYLPQLESQVIDIPYDDETSLLVILPRRKVRLQAVLDKMRNKSLLELLSAEVMSVEEVDLSLPKFSTSFSGVLNRPLFNLGVKTLLNPGAKLPKISDKAYITKVTHKAEIETNEEGTEASAVTFAHVVYKTTPVTFQANRPFIYFVNHSPTRLILFAGKYSDPTNT